MSIVYSHAAPCVPGTRPLQRTEHGTQRACLENGVGNGDEVARPASAHGQPLQAPLHIGAFLEKASVLRTRPVAAAAGDTAVWRPDLKPRLDVGGDVRVRVEECHLVQPLVDGHEDGAWRLCVVVCFPSVPGDAQRPTWGPVRRRERSSRAPAGVAAVSSTDSKLPRRSPDVACIISSDRLRSPHPPPPHLGRGLSRQESVRPRPWAL
jgi:hypothetical protein